MGIRLCHGLIGLLLLPSARGFAQEPGVAPKTLPRIGRTLWVAPGAQLGGDGSAEHPLGALEEARDRLRADPGGPGNIELLDGAFVRTGPFELDGRDSGLVLRAAPGAAPRLVGGLVLTNPSLHALEDGALAARLPTDAARAAVRVVDLPADFEPAGPVRRGMGSPVVAIGTEVFVDGHALTRARWPNAGFAKLEAVLDTGSIPRNRADDIAPELRETGPERGGVFRPAGVTPERLARWASAEEPWAFGYWFHDWADEQLLIAAVDPAAGTIRLGAPHRYGLKAGTTFYVTNLLEELDAPGEFYFDRKGHRLLFWPPEGRPTSQSEPSDSSGPASELASEGSSSSAIAEILISTLEEPLIHARDMHGFAVQGLRFEGTRGAAFVAEDCRDVTVRDCRITNTGTDGIRLRGFDNAVLDCQLDGIGATGVNLNGGDRTTLTPAHNRLQNSRIHHFGRVYRTYQPAAQLGGVGQIVTGNEFAHAPHSAIIFGGNEHLIEGNEIFDVLRETGDSGAIYCGRDWTMHGTRIVGNFLHHLGGTEGRWQNAIYLDDMASGIEVADNLIWRCHWGMLVGGGRDLDIHGNTFVECELGIRFDARGVGWMANHIADPRTSTLHQRLAAMPIAKEPWASRYPSLSSYLTDRFGRPAGSRVTDNTFFATPSGRIDDRESVAVTGGFESGSQPDWLETDGYFASGPRTGGRRTDVVGGLTWQPIMRSEALARIAGIPYAERALPTPVVAAVLEHGQRKVAEVPGVLTLAAWGVSDWTLVLPAAASALEREAAQSLRDTLHKKTGVTLPIVAEPFVGPHRILIGATEAGLALAEELGIDRAVLGEDGFAIRAVGADLLLIAGSKEPGPSAGQGIVYAAAHLAETQWGARLWTPGEVELEPSPTATLPADLSLTESPPIGFRQVNYGPANDPDYRRWHKLDRVQEETGRLWAPHWVHSFFEHVDPDEHFAEHPEYFSLVGDGRTPSQLCLTNPAVFDLVVASFERVFAQYPEVRFISFSQEDNYDACACEPCAAIDAREGTQMGALLTFVNHLAERFPERVISTLAYQYSRKPPKTLRPRPNVSIMLCTIEEDRARPIAANPKSGFPADLAGWSAIASDLFLWDYEVQFASPVAPFPNLRTLGPNVRWFRDAGVHHVFLQGNGLHTELAELRCYVLAKLAWDPDTDVEATIDEFLAGFYGPAAPHLRAYIDLLHDQLEASGDELVLYGNPALAKDSWLRPAVLKQAWKFLDAAAESVAREQRDCALRLGTGLGTSPLGSRLSLALAKSNAHVARVRTARLPLMYAQLEIAKRQGARPGGIWSEADGLLLPRPAIRALVDDFLAGCEAAGIDRLREYDLTLAAYRADWERLFDPALPNHRAFGQAVLATPPPSPKYADGEVARLVDGLPGARPGSAPVTRAYGENWVGWEGTDATVTLVLPVVAAGESPPTRLSFAALQEPRSWVWLPRSIQVDALVGDGPWRELTTLRHTTDETSNLARDFVVELPKDGRLRELRLTIDALETCPAWHLGAGGPAWFFLDELRVE